MSSQFDLFRRVAHASSNRLATILMASIVLAATGCTTMPMEESGTLTSYSNLSAQKSKLGKKRRFFVDGDYLSQVRTVRIIPASYTFVAASKVKTPADRSLVTNALDRALCVALSDRYHVVPPDRQADLTVRSVVTDIVPTNKRVAAAATVVSVGGGFALPENIPVVGVPRIPVGLGGLSVEAEAVDSRNVQRAAMMWGRGANFLQDKPRYSEVGDAYSQATKFANDFSRLLIKGREPRMLDLSMPSGHRVRSWFGGKPKYEACEAYGRAPGLPGALSAKFGLPPQWTDKRGKTPG